MKLRLDMLTDGSHRESWAGQVEGVDLIYPELSAAVRVNARIHRLHDLITVRASMRARIERPCDRCLKPALLVFDAPLYVIVRRRTVALAPEEGDEGEVLLTVAYEEQEVDLTAQIRDGLIVEVPMTIYCKDDCKGLCPTCGADLNEGPCSCPVVVDPRWAALKVVRRERS